MPIRRRFGIRRRVADTTLRDALATVAPAELRPILHSVTRTAIRSKSIAIDFDLPFGVVSMDGKYVTVPSVDDKYAQRSSRAEGACTITGLFRLVTYDAGACSKVNADYIRSRDLHYLLGLKGSQPQLLYWAELSFKNRSADAPDARCSLSSNASRSAPRRVASNPGTSCSPESATLCS